jgi:2-polyprenyl-3-methyl-5-hydroxy-6-metoxy-1,4-benzoquinol methylase
MPYHKYVFDLKKRKFVGKFEEMYQHEDIEGFNSWHSSDLTHLAKLISLAILNRYNFKNILDFGCGKGAFTHILKKRNNYVLGLDISKTAIKKAKANYGNKIDFKVIQNNDFTSFVEKQKFDLTIILETLSYIRNWRKVIEDISKFSIYI